MEGMEDKNDTAKESERDPDGMNERVREQLRSVEIPGELRFEVNSERRFGFTDRAEL
jgi:hypothetical protein